MKLLIGKLTEIINAQSANTDEDKKVKEIEQLLNDMKKTGLLKKPSYDLPLVDTLGKAYYSSINKHKVK